MKNSIQMLHLIRTIGIIGLILCSTCFCSAQIECGTKIRSIRTLQKTSPYGNPLLLPQYIPTTPRTIALALHIVRQSNGAGGLPSTSISAAITQLNNTMASAMLNFIVGSIDNIDDDTYYILDSDAECDNLMLINRKPNRLNVYFVGGSTQGFAGRAEDIPGRALVVINEAVAMGITLPHEIGHCLDLFHTHEIHPTGPDIDLIEKINRTDLPGCSANWSTTGDLLGDTPADPFNSNAGLYFDVDPSCQWTGSGTDPCGNTNYTPDPTNLMSYGRNCRNHFTEQQIGRMHYALENKVSDLVSSLVQVTFANQVETQDAGGLLLVSNAIPVNSGDALLLYTNTLDNAKTLGEGSSNPDRFPSFQGGSTVKHNNWNNLNQEFHLQESFDVLSGLQFRNAKYIPLDPVTISTQLIEGGSGVGCVDFKDPWYLADASGSQPNQFLPCLTQHPTGAYNQTTGGVFLNQGGVPPNLTPPYYTIRSPQSMNFGGSLGVRNAYFLNWNYDPNQISLQHPNSAETPIVFKQANAVIAANVKGSRFSTNSATWQNSGQRKYVQTPDGWQHMVYESALNGVNHVFYENKPPNGNWQIVANDNGALSIDNGGGKSPSLDWRQSSPANKMIVIAFQQGSDIVVKSYEYNSTLDTYCDYGCPVFPISSGEAAGSNVKPNISWNSSGTFLVVWERSAGISYQYGYLTSGYFSLPGSPSMITGTNNYSRNTAIAADYGVSLSSTFYIAWEQFIPPMQGPPTVPVKYCSVNVNASNGTVTPGSITTLSSSAMKQNSHISIVYMNNGSPRLCWIADYSGTEDPWQTKAVFYNTAQPNSFSSYYYYCKSASINKKDDNSNFYFTFSAIFNIQGWNDHNFVVSGNNLSTYTDLSTNGRDVQLCNGSSNANMYVSSYYPAAVPYHFKSSGSLGGLSKEGSAISQTRGIVVENNNAGMYYSLGNMSIDGTLINFLQDANRDSSKSLTVNTLNTLLISEPFEIRKSSEVIFDESQFIGDSASAAAVLGEKGYLSFKADLLDAVTGKVIGSIKESKFQKTMLPSSKESAYRLNTSSIENRRVKIKITVMTNMENLQFSYINDYTDGGEKSVLRKESAPEELTLQAPAIITEYALEQNYPNPFNPTTTIKYQIPYAGYVTLKVYDMLGREVATLADEVRETGYYTVTFDASRLASGTYIARLTAQSETGAPYTQTMKMMLMK